MNWKTQIFKPRWRHKDPAIRRDAVASGQEPELVAALAEIFRTDEDPGVRAAAARRIASPATLHAALAGETAAPVRAAIQERLRQLVSSDAGERAPLAERLAIVQGSGDRELLELVAAAAPEPELRSAALARVQRQGFLGDRAIEDPDAGIRRQAAAAISQQSTLKRVIAATRTSDKALHQQLSERLHAEGLAAGDPEAVRTEALRICESLEQALLTGDGPSATEIETLRQRWAKLGGRAPGELQARFERDCQRAQSATAPAAAPPPEPPKDEAPATEASATEAPATEAEAESGEGQSAEEAPDPRLAEALESIRQYAGSAAGQPAGARIESLARNWQQAWSELGSRSAAAGQLQGEAERLLASLRDSLRQATEQQQALLDEAQEQLGHLQQALDSGSLHKALEHRARLEELGRQLGKDRRWKRVQARLQATLGRLRELRDWQHWANDKIRKRLIDEMDALPASGLHPDALMERIKALQAEWKALEASEQIPGDRHYAAVPWMWRTFNAAGRKAFETAKPFLEKRSELQTQRVEEVHSLCEQLAGVAANDSPDWNALRRAMGQARKALRELSSLPASARKKTARRLKRALEAANTVMQGHYGEIEKQKLRLIREAAQLQHATDRGEAIQRAKALQAEWKAAGSLWRRRESELWREFRAPLDPLFEQLDADREAERERQTERLAAQRSVCDELEAVLALDEQGLSEQHGRVQGLEDQWREFRHPDQALRRRFEHLIRQFRARERAQHSAAARQMRQRWRDKAGLLHRAESALQRGKLDEALSGELRGAWPEPGSSEVDDCLDSRFRAALEGDTDSIPTTTKEVVEAARKICINLEFLAGLPAPESEKDLRMQYQVERLSAAMSGERQRVPAMEEARQLEREWLCLGLLPERDYKAFGKRLHIALEQIIEE